jgi:hypothetical protein
VWGTGNRHPRRATVACRHHLGHARVRYSVPKKVVSIFQLQYNPNYALAGMVRQLHCVRSVTAAAAIGCL